MFIGCYVGQLALKKRSLFDASSPKGLIAAQNGDECAEIQ